MERRNNQAIFRRVRNGAAHVDNDRRRSGTQASMELTRRN
jgi:hypothetical protein